MKATKEKQRLTELLTIRLNKETRRKLEEFAEKEHRSLGQVIRLALENFLQEGNRNGNNKG